MLATIEALDPNQICEQLGSTFGGEFRVWQACGSNWYCSITGESPGPSLSRWFDLLADRSGLREGEFDVATETVDQQLWAAAVYDSTCDPAVIVAGEVRLSPREMARLAIRETLRNSRANDAELQRQSLIDSYAVQSLANYEQLSFLRHISRHIEACDASRSLSDVASTLLPSLRHLIGASGIAFIQSPISDIQHVAPVLERAIGYLVPVTEDGQVPIVVEDWPAIVHEISAKNPASPIVWNSNVGLGASKFSTIPATIHSYILIPINKEGDTFGWLLAVNKCDARAALGVPPTNSLGYNEFGSIEASLIQATASIFSTHGLNSRRFRELEALIVDVVYTLVNVIEAKDEYTLGHSDRVAAVAKRLAEELALPQKQCEEIFLSGLLHDIGKVGVADKILRKPGKLTVDEYNEIKTHPEIGYRLLQGLSPFQNLLPGVLHHHEAVDGSGYPHALVGESIPLMARVIAVADAYDAMTSDRPYRPGMPREQAEAILTSGKSKYWDAKIVDAYFAARDDVLSICQNWRASHAELMSSCIGNCHGLDVERSLQRSIAKWRNGS